MMYKPVLFLIAVVCCFTTLIDAFNNQTTDVALEKRSSHSWSFSNWTKYKKGVLGKTSNWGSAWGIPEHGGWLWFGKGGDILNSLVKDPAGNTKNLVLRVTYPVKSRNPEVNPVGGLGFIAQPFKIPSNAKTVTLQYSVWFPKGFKFVRGGKLPGLFGGHGSCTGGTDDKTCFTTRLMWRDNGEGEVYAYLPHKQRKNLCDNKVNICNPDYGYSLGRGTYKFTTGKWTVVRQVLTLNTPGKQNGNLKLIVNGKTAMVQKDLVFRSTSAAHVTGIMFHTFFGGSDSSWITPKTQYTYFKNFSLIASS